MKLVTTTLVTAGLLLAIGSTPAAADEVGMLIDATMIKPLGEEGRVTNSHGFGGEIRMMPHSEPFTVSIGGYYGLGEHRHGRTARDIYDFHVNFGMKSSRSRDKVLIPFLSVGLNVLFMTTHMADAGQHRGTTLGLNARAGFMGHLSKRWIYRVSGSYLGAIVPGTGDDLGGLVLQAGIGKLFDD